MHAVADGVRPLAMPVRLVTVWSSENHVDEALAFASADACGDLLKAGPVVASGSSWHGSASAVCVDQPAASRRVNVLISCGFGRPPHSPFLFEHHSLRHPRTF